MDSLQEIFGVGKEPSAVPVFDEYRPSEQRRGPRQKDAQNGLGSFFNRLLMGRKADRHLRVFLPPLASLLLHIQCSLNFSPNL
ncbi:MAG: hypothetical protein WCH57_05185 [Verrucomicrobiota bacterium]